MAEATPRAQPPPPPARSPHAPQPRLGPRPVSSAPPCFASYGIEPAPLLSVPRTRKAWLPPQLVASLKFQLRIASPVTPAPAGCGRCTRQQACPVSFTSLLCPQRPPVPTHPKLPLVGPREAEPITPNLPEVWHGPSLCLEMTGDGTMQLIQG